MRSAVQWLTIAALVGVYLATLWALLHPNVTPAYKAYFIDHISSDWNPVRYPGTPEQGIKFSRAGLPEWVGSTSGFSFRQSWGRWTDSNLAKVPSVSFTRQFNGPICVEFTALPTSSLVGKTIAVRMGGKTKTLQLVNQDFAEYRVPLTLEQGADRLEFLLPDRLPVNLSGQDDRRLGLAFASLRISAGSCAGN